MGWGMIVVGCTQCPTGWAPVCVDHVAVRVPEVVVAWHRQTFRCRWGRPHPQPHRHHHHDHPRPHPHQNPLQGLTDMDDDDDDDDDDEDEDGAMRRRRRGMLRDVAVDVCDHLLWLP